MAHRSDASRLEASFRLLAAVSGEHAKTATNDGESERIWSLCTALPAAHNRPSLFHGQPFELFIWNVPALFAPNPEVRAMFVEAHEFGAKALIALIGLHAAAALFHQFVLRDNVLQRMLPSTSSPARVRKAKAQLATSDVE